MEDGKHHDNDYPRNTGFYLEWEANVKTSPSRDSVPNHVSFHVSVIVGLFCINT